MLSGRDDLGESRMREICMSGSTREREAAVFGLCASHSVLSSLLYWRKLLAECCCLEWKNLKLHFEALVFSKGVVGVQESNGGAELWLIPRPKWRAVRTRGGLQTRLRALRAV